MAAAASHWLLRIAGWVAKRPRGVAGEVSPRREITEFFRTSGIWRLWRLR